MWGSGGIALLFLITAPDGEVFAYTPPAAPHPTKRQLAGHQSRYENFREDKNIFSTLVWIHDCLQKFFHVFPAKLKKDSVQLSK
jgi:hypothetical protein